MHSFALLNVRRINSVGQTPNPAGNCTGFIPKVTVQSLHSCVFQTCTVLSFPTEETMSTIICGLYLLLPAVICLVVTVRNFILGDVV